MCHGYSLSNMQQVTTQNNLDPVYASLMIYAWCKFKIVIGGKMDYRNFIYLFHEKNKPIKSQKNSKMFSPNLTSKLWNTIFVYLEREGYIGVTVSVKTVYLIKKGRDGMQEVLKKGSKKAFSVNLERQIFETKQTNGSPKKILDTVLKQCSFPIDVVRYFNYSQVKFKI